MIFGRFGVRFWGRFGRPRGWEMEPKLDPDRTQIEDRKEDAKRSSSKSSWGGPGEVLEPSWNDLGPSWPNLRPSWDDLEAAGGGQNQCFSLGCSILFETYTFRTKNCILTGLGAILGPSWGDLRAILAELEAIFGRFEGGGGAESLFFLCFVITF